MGWMLAPSILSADFAALGAAAAAAEAAMEAAGQPGVLHVDVMDGRFVPNLTLGPAVVKALKPHTRLPLDVHLMIEEPERLADAFVEAGAARLSVHLEACVHLHRLLTHIRERGAIPGVALNPSTPVAALDAILPFVGQVIVMTVNPGFGGQRFIPEMLAKVEWLVRERQTRGLAFQIEVDGGVNMATLPDVFRAGADIMVAGQAFFGQPDLLAALRGMQAALPA